MSTQIEHRTNGPREVVRRYLDSFAGGDPEIIAAFVAEDFINEHTSGLGSGCRGRDVYKQQLTSFLTEMAGLTYEVEHLVDSPASETGTTEVAVFYTMRATWKGNAPFEIRGAQRLVVQNGAISHRTDYWDSAVFLARVDEDARQALAALGITP